MTGSVDKCRPYSSSTTILSGEIILDQRLTPGSDLVKWLSALSQKKLPRKREFVENNATKTLMAPPLALCRSLLIMLPSPGLMSLCRRWCELVASTSHFQLSNHKANDKSDIEKKNRNIWSPLHIFRGISYNKANTGAADLVPPQAGLEVYILDQRRKRGTRVKPGSWYRNSILMLLLSNYCGGCASNRPRFRDQNMDPFSPLMRSG